MPTLAATLTPGLSSPLLGSLAVLGFGVAALNVSAS